MPKVTFAYYGEQLASSRLRAKIPQHELAKLGICKGRDVLVYGKHWLSFDQIKGYRRYIFDCCDDHFNDQFGDYYRAHIDHADEVTCNSAEMARIIKREMDRDAIVIPEPYEGKEGVAKIGPELLWYGHASNLGQIIDFPKPVTILTNQEGYKAWTPEAFAEEIAKPCIVVIPTGAKKAKSENRMVEAIRAGRYVCAGPMPSYEPFYRWFPCIDIPTHIDLALGQPYASVDAIKGAQDYILERYAPATIARQWLEVL